jgi:predicted CXXCH cytochrome family protein
MGKLKAMEWVDSVHARSWLDDEGKEKEMSCVNCHKLHEKDVRVKDRTQQAQICYKCHEKTEQEHPRFEDKGIVYDRLTCWDCHDVHQLIYQGPEPEGG